MYTNNQLPPSSEQQPSPCCNPSSWWSPTTEDRRRLLHHNNTSRNKRMKTDTNGVDIIARELHELTVEEREVVYEDLHGVSQIQEETTEFITQKLEEMNVALDTNANNFSLRNLRDYQRALFYWPNLKYDKEFKLMFLRADYYDGVKAAKRLVNYYIQKRIVFGEGKLVKRITMDDLTEDDIHVLRSGFLTELPNKDRSGRPVIYLNMSKFDPSTMSIESATRAWWYMIMVACSESKGAKANGICCLGHPPNTTDLSFVQWHMRVWHIYIHCLPVRITAFHCFYRAPDVGYWVMNNHILLDVGKYSRLRFRGHLGSDVEIAYELLAFGIRLDGISLQKDATDDADKSIFDEYVLRRKEIDDKNNQNDKEEAIERGYVPYPHPCDVLIGRGKPYRDWIGSKVWNVIVDKYAGMYKSAETRFDKSLYAFHVIEDYKQSSDSRFLLEPIPSQQQQQQQEGGWKVLDLDSPEAKQKASSALQNRAKALSRAADSEGQGA